jgi:hypothetical protein
MKKIKLYFDNDDLTANGLSPQAVNFISTTSGHNPNVLQHMKYLFGEHFIRTKDWKWQLAEEGDRYFYPIACQYPMNDLKHKSGHPTMGYTYVTIPPKVIQDCVNNKAKILIYDSWEGDPMKFYHEIINEIASNYRLLTPDHIIVMCGNHKMPDNTLFHNVPYMWFQSYDQPVLNLNNLTQRIKNKTLRPDKFIMMSRRASAHRLDMVKQLWDLRDQGAISYTNSSTHLFENVKPEWYAMHGNGEDTIDHTIEEIYSQLPIRLDEFTDVITNPVHDGDHAKFLNSHLHVVLETYQNPCHDDMMFFSEKTFKPVQWMQPFVIGNHANSLTELKKHGYETFGKWINEDYDNVLDYKARTTVLADTVREFCKNTQEQIAEIHLDMLPVLEHNFHHRINNTRVMEEEIYDRLYSTFS